MSLPASHNHRDPVTRLAAGPAKERLEKISDLAPMAPIGTDLSDLLTNNCRHQTQFLVLLARP
jgi:hypothetical protein